MDVQPHAETRLADRVGDLAEVGHAARIVIVPGKMPRGLGERRVGKKQHAESASLGEFDELADICRRGPRRPEIGALLERRAAECCPGGEMEAAFHCGHGVEKPLSRLGASDDHGRCAAEADRSLGRCRQQHVAVARPHFGVRFEVSSAQADAEAVVVNGIEPLAHVRQLAHVEPHQVDPVDCLSLQIEKLQGQVVAGALHAIRGLDAGGGKIDHQLAVVEGSAGGGKPRPSVDPPPDDLGVGPLGIANRAASAVDNGDRRRLAGAVVDSAGLVGEAPQHAVLADFQPQVRIFQHHGAGGR